MQKSYRRLITTCLLICSFMFLCGIDACEEPNTPNDRFTDNGDGTVTDDRTGLVWLQNANCYDRLSWSDAMSSAAGLNSGECGLIDGSAEGAWHLPTKEEFQGIGTDPPTTWEAGYPGVAWTIPGSPFVSVQSYYYWSRTEYSTDDAWLVGMFNGRANVSTKGRIIYVWPVRSDN